MFPDCVASYGVGQGVSATGASLSHLHTHNRMPRDGPAMISALHEPENDGSVAWNVAQIQNQGKVKELLEAAVRQVRTILDAPTARWPLHTQPLLCARLGAVCADEGG